MGNAVLNQAMKNKNVTVTGLVEKRGHPLIGRKIQDVVVGGRPPTRF